MISRSIFLTLICHHQQMHRSLGFIIRCVHGRYDISSGLLKSYAFDLFAFFLFVCWYTYAYAIIFTPFSFSRIFFSIIDFYWLSNFDWSKSHNDLFLFCISLIPSIQSTLIPLIYVIDNIDQVRICVTVIIWKEMNQLLLLV